MLQTFSNWLWGNSIDYNEMKLGRSYAVYKIEQAYLNYKSKQRIAKQESIQIQNVTKQICFQRNIIPNRKRHR